MSGPGSAIAVVATYNSRDLVVERVRELLASSFDMIVVCDDHSSDATVETLAAEENERVIVVRGKQNLGPGGNRNRALDHLEDHEVDYLFFLDADCRLVYRGDVCNLIEESFAEAGVGVVGFSILNPDGSPMRWNYGSLMHPMLEAADERLEQLFGRKLIAKEQFMLGAPSRAASFRLLPEKQPREVGWVAEGCFSIRRELFRKLEGFDAAMRFHEAHDLSARIRHLGLRTVFHPVPVAQHLEYDSRSESRVEDEIAAKFHYFHKHWGMSEDVFRRLLESE